MSTVIVFKDFDAKAICGHVSLKRGEEFILIYSQDEDREYVCFPNSDKIVARYSQNYITHFARNDDKNGLLRGDLTTLISHSITTPEQEELLRTAWVKYLLPYTDVILFNNSFYDAPIEDLEKMQISLNIEVK